MIDQGLKKTDIIDVFTVGPGNFIGSAIVPGFVDTLRVNNKEAVAIGQFVEFPFSQPEHALAGAAAAVQHHQQRPCAEMPGLESRLVQNISALQPVVTEGVPGLPRGVCTRK